MKTSSQRLMSLLLLILLMGCCVPGPVQSEEPERIRIVPEITCESESQLALEWTPVTLRVRAKLPTLPHASLVGMFDLEYRWNRDGAPITEVIRGEAGAELTIPHVLQPTTNDYEPHDVGTYTVDVQPVFVGFEGYTLTLFTNSSEVVVFLGDPDMNPDGVAVEAVTNSNFTLQWSVDDGPPTTERFTLERVTSGPMHLSVYSLYRTNSNGGTLTAPIDVFTSGTGSLCGDELDRFVVYYPFDGPGVTKPSAHFPNPYNRTNLFVSTRLRLNDAGLFTCIEVRKNFFPGSLVCANHGVPDLPVHSSYDDGVPPVINFGRLAEVNKAHGMERGKTYRVVIRYASGTLPADKRTVSWNWVYTDHY